MGLPPRQLPPAPSPRSKPTETPTSTSAPTPTDAAQQPEGPQETEAPDTKWKHAIEDDAINKLKGIRQALIDDTIFKLQYTRDVYRWQLISSVLIFVAVLVVVGIGLTLSWMHFRKSFNTPLLGKDKAGSERPAQQSSSEISAPGIKIKITSSVIGLIILGASIVFLFLYLKFVYPMQ